MKKTNINIKNEKKGFTLLEVVMVIGIIAVLSSVSLAAINPNRQFKLARDSQRTSNIQSIANAIGQNMSEHGGILACASGTAPTISTTTKVIKYKINDETFNDGGIDLYRCIVPDYLANLPLDPSKSEAYLISVEDYNSMYSLNLDSNGRIVVSATGELTTDINTVR
ncbi:MAG: type II secretion system protein [bacterium]|nr:type II secretion system protein [bacterium]